MACYRQLSATKAPTRARIGAISLPGPRNCLERDRSASASASIWRTTMSNIKLTSARSSLLTILAAFFVISGAWGQTFRVLHSFGASGDGLLPVGGQVFDRQGNLYGVTEAGPLGNGCLGNEGCGTVYQLKPNGDGTWSESVIHAFNGSDAAFPLTSPSFDPQGNLDGTADGHAGAGTFPAVVYQLSPTSNGTWTESILYQFPNSRDNSPGALTYNPAGNVYE